MSTTLRKAVTRVTVEPFVSFGPDRGRPFVVTLEPGDIITMRPKGRRTAISARLADVYTMILIGRSNAERMRRLREKKEAKAVRRASAKTAREARKFIAGGGGA